MSGRLPDLNEAEIQDLVEVLHVVADTLHSADLVGDGPGSGEDELRLVLVLHGFVEEIVQFLSSEETISPLPGSGS